MKGKKNVRRGKTNSPLKISSVENTLAHMPHYNPYQTGHGPHGNKGYNRRTQKQQLRKEINEVLWWNI